MQVITHLEWKYVTVCAQCGTICPRLLMVDMMINVFYVMPYLGVFTPCIFILEVGWPLLSGMIVCVGYLYSFMNCICVEDGGGGPLNPYVYRRNTLNPLWACYSLCYFKHMSDKYKGTLTHSHSLYIQYLLSLHFKSSWIYSV